MKKHWLDPSRLRLYSAALLLLYVFILSGVFFRPLGPGEDTPIQTTGNDFMAFWSASSLALDGKAALAYDRSAMEAIQRTLVSKLKYSITWQYPPTALLFVLPFALLPWLLSFAIFVSTTGIAFVAVARKVLPHKEAWLPLLAFPAVFINIFAGQNAFLTGALIGGALLLLDRRPVVAGVLIGLLTIKPQLGLAIPLALIAGGHWRALVSASVTALLLFGISLMVFGPEVLPAFRAQLAVVSQWMIDGKLPLPRIPSFFSLARQLDCPTTIAWLVHAAVGLPVLAAIAWTWRCCRQAALRSTVLIVGSLLLSPYVFDYDLMWLVLALGWFTAYCLQQGWRDGERGMMLAVWLLPLEITLQFQFDLKPQFAPMLLLAFLLMVLRRVRDDGTDAIPTNAPGHLAQPEKASAESLPVR